MKRLILILLFLSSCLLTSQVFANGFQVLLQGNRQLAMGNQGVALRPDVSSVFWNPGSMGMMKRSGLMAGIDLIWSKVIYTASDIPNSTYSSHTENPVSPPFHVFGVWSPENKKYNFGLGVYTPYGSTVRWKEDWRGDMILQEIQLHSFFIQPTFSYRILDNLSIGAGFVYAFGTVNLQRRLPIYTEQGQAHLELDGSANGYGYNLGIFYEPIKQLSFGVNYRSKVNMKVKDGDAMFYTPPALSFSFPENNTFSAEVPLAANLVIGASYHPNEKWNVGVETVYTRWSSYKSLAFDFKKETENVQDTESPRNWKDTWQIKIGAEYMVTKDLALRAGFYYDPPPINAGYLTPESPNAIRLNYTAGIGYNIKDHVQLDIGFLYVSSFEEEQTLQDLIDAGTYNTETGQQDALPGTYDYHAFIPGISIAYYFKNNRNSENQ